MLKSTVHYYAKSKTKEKPFFPKDKYLSFCFPMILGCMNLEADNYNLEATYDDGSCVYFGCTNPLAENFNLQANFDDDSCVIYGCTLSNFPN